MWDTLKRGVNHSSSPFHFTPLSSPDTAEVETKNKRSRAKMCCAGREINSRSTLIVIVPGPFFATHTHTETLLTGGSKLKWKDEPRLLSSQRLPYLPQLSSSEQFPLFGMCSLNYVRILRISTDTLNFCFALSLSSSFSCIYLCLLHPLIGNK